MKTSSGAAAVQIVHSSRCGSRKIEHLGSAHTEPEVEALKIAAAKRLAGGQDELDLGLDVPAERTVATAEPLPILASRMGHLWDALSRAYDALGFDHAAQEDEVFRQLVLARIIEPTSKLDSLRVLEEVGIAPASYPTMNRRLPVYAKDEWRQGLATACAKRAALGAASLVLYDVTTLYFETDKADGFREPGFSKERGAHRVLFASDHLGGRRFSRRSDQLSHWSSFVREVVTDQAGESAAELVMSQNAARVSRWNPPDSSWKPLDSVAAELNDRPRNRRDFLYLCLSEVISRSCR